MARNLYLRHLLDEIALADQHVAMARDRVANQEEMVAWRDRTGKASGLSQDLLLTLKAVLASHEQHRQRLVRELTR